MLALVAVMLLPLASHAQGQPLITQVQQLNGEKGVRQHKDSYAALSAGNVIYEKCGADLGIEDFQREFLKKKFMDTSKAYVIAYQDAYVKYTQAAPPQKFVNDVTKYLIKIQQDAVDNIALAIRQKGCSDGRLRPILKYIEAMRKQDKILQNAKPVTPAAPY